MAKVKSWFVGEPIRNSDCLGICCAWRDGGERGEETIAEVLPTPDGNVTALRQANLLADAPELLRTLGILLKETDQHAEGDCPMLKTACRLARALIEKHKEV